MTPKEFVELFYKDKTDYLKSCLDENSGNLLAAEKLKALHLNDEQKQIMAEAVDVILTDAYYSFLLGIDGGANIGGSQVTYKLYDEDGNLITDGGELEGYIWEYFHDKK